MPYDGGVFVPFMLVFACTFARWSVCVLLILAGWSAGATCFRISWEPLGLAWVHVLLPAVLWLFRLLLPWPSFFFQVALVFAAGWLRAFILCWRLVIFVIILDSRGSRVVWPCPPKVRKRRARHLQ